MLTVWDKPALRSLAEWVGQGGPGLLVSQGVKLECHNYSMLRLAYCPKEQFFWSMWLHTPQDRYRTAPRGNGFSKGLLFLRRTCVRTHKELGRPMQHLHCLDTDLRRAQKKGSQTHSTSLLGKANILIFTDILQKNFCMYLSLKNWSFKIWIQKFGTSFLIHNQMDQKKFIYTHCPVHAGAV